MPLMSASSLPCDTLLPSFCHQSGKVCFLRLASYWGFEGLQNEVQNAKTELAAIFLHPSANALSGGVSQDREY